MEYTTTNSKNAEKLLKVLVTYGYIIFVMASIIGLMATQFWVIIL